MHYFLSKWSCMQKGIFFCVSISIVNFFLVAGNRVLGNQLLEWTTSQDNVKEAYCIIEK